MNDAAEIRGILSAYFTRAGLWSGISFVAQAVTVLAGAVLVVFASASLGVGIAVGVISLCASAGRWRGETLRGRAEFLLRQIEYSDGFGWRLNSQLLADAVSQAIPFQKAARQRGLEQGNFFASPHPPGPARALANLRESTWWTEQLSRYIAPRATIVLAVIAVLSLWSLLIAAILVRNSDPLAVSSVLTASLCLVFSADFLRLPLSFYRLAADASRIGSAARHEAASPHLEEKTVLLLMQEYQIDREKGPVIPDWLWRHRRNYLNDIWKKYGANEPTPE